MKTGLYDVLRIEELRALAVATRLEPSVESLPSHASSATKRYATEYHMRLHRRYCCNATKL